MVLTEEQRLRKKETDRAWREANKEKIYERHRAWREANKEKIYERRRAYSQTLEGKKSNTISQWKQSGLIHEDMSSLYDTYLQRTHCDICKSDYKDSFDRCMDHDHETHLFRQFLCRPCNNKDSWKKIIRIRM